MKTIMIMCLTAVIGLTSHAVLAKSKSCNINMYFAASQNLAGNSQYKLMIKTHKNESHEFTVSAKNQNQSSVQNVQGTTSMNNCPTQANWPATCCVRFKATAYSDGKPLASATFAVSQNKEPGIDPVFNVAISDQKHTNPGCKLTHSALGNNFELILNCSKETLNQ